MNEAERILVEVESVVVDPDFKHVLKNAEDINNLVREIGSVNELEATALIEDLNREWADLKFAERMLHVNGNVYMGETIGDIVYASRNGAPVSLNDGKVYSTKFYMESVPVTVGTAIDVQQQVLLRGYVRYDIGSGENGRQHEECSIPLNEEATIEYRGMTAKKAERWLDVYHQDAKIEIDQALLQADNEAEALLNLKDVQLPKWEKNKKESRNLRKVLEAYLGESLKFEQDIPYRASLYGMFMQLNTETNEWDDVEFEGLQKSLLKISTPLVEKGIQEERYVLYVSAKIIEARGKKPRYVRIPVEAFETLETGRDIYRTYSS